MDDRVWPRSTGSPLIFCDSCDWSSASFSRVRQLRGLLFRFGCPSRRENDSNAAGPVWKLRCSGRGTVFFSEFRVSRAAGAGNCKVVVDGSKKKLVDVKLVLRIGLLNLVLVGILIYLFTWQVPVQQKEKYSNSKFVISRSSEFLRKLQYLLRLQNSVHS